MSDSSINPVTEAQELVDTFKKIPSPSTDDMNEFIAGISNVLNRADITEEQTGEISGILVDILGFTAADALGGYSFLDIDSAQMTPEMSIKFLLALRPIFFASRSSTYYMELLSAAENNQETMSRADYDAKWEEISSNLKEDGITTAAIATIKTQFYATLTAYLHLNYSNLMTRTVHENDLSSWFRDFRASLLDEDQLSSNIEYPTVILTVLGFFSSDNWEDEYYISTREFIAACGATLGYLSSYLDSSSIKEIKSSLYGVIRSKFFVSDTYSTDMNLSTATTLTSTVSTNLAIGAMPLPPELVELFVTQVFILIHSAGNADGMIFTITQKETLIKNITEYFEKIDFSNGLTASEVGDFWQYLRNRIIDILPDTLDEMTERLTIIQTRFSNLIAPLYGQNVGNLLSSQIGYDSIDWGMFTGDNPVSGNQGAVVRLLSEWEPWFIDSLSSDLDDITLGLLSSVIKDLMQAENNSTYGMFNNLVSTRLTGSSYIQVSCEILLFLSNFLEQEQLDKIASDFTDMLVANYNTNSEIAEITKWLSIGSMIAIAVVLIIAVIITGGLAAAAAGAFGAAVTSAIAPITVLTTAISTKGAVVTAAMSSAAAAAAAGIVSATATLAVANAAVGVTTFMLAAGLGGGSFGIHSQLDGSDS